MKLLEAPIRHWACPSCNTTDVTQKTEAHTQMHQCPGLGGLNAPLVTIKPTDTVVKDARHVLLERQDYMAEDYPFVTPIMACRTDHWDGSNDQTVYPPCAVMHLEFLRPSLNRSAAPGHDLIVTPDVALSGGGANHHRFHDPKIGRIARLARQVEAQMAWSTSNGNAYYLWGLGQATAAGKPATDAFKVALYGNAVTPAQSTTAALTQYNGAASTWVTANETSGTGYTAGGQWMSATPTAAGGAVNTTWTQLTASPYNVVTFTSTGSPSWTTSSFTAYGCLVYDYTLSTTTGQAISWNYFGGAQTVTSGTFTITWNASGIMTLTC